MLIKICLLEMKFEYAVSLLSLINVGFFFFQLDFQFPLLILMVLKARLDPRHFLSLNKSRASSAISEQYRQLNII